MKNKNYYFIIFSFLLFIGCLSLTDKFKLLIAVHALVAIIFVLAYKAMEQTLLMDIKEQDKN